MEARGPAVYEAWTYEQLLAEVKLARARFARPGETADEGVRRAWFLEVLDWILENHRPLEDSDKLQAYRNGMEPTPVEEPLTSEPYAVVKGIYREACRRDVVHQLAADLGSGFYDISNVARIPVDVWDGTS